MDATAPSAREVGHIAVTAAASSIIAGLPGTYDAPLSNSDTSGVSDATQKSNTSPTAVALELGACCYSTLFISINSITWV